MLQDKPVIFLTFANDHHGNFLEALEAERDGLFHHLAQFQKESGIVHPSGSSMDQILAGLNQFTGHISIFHFSGHSDGEALQLETESKDIAELAGNTLIDILKHELQAEPKLRLVFLNACKSKGLLRAFQEIKVPAIICTDKAVSDSQAKRFAIAFYRSFASGKGNTLETAFQHAKASLEPEKSGNRIFRSFVREGTPDESEIPWGLYVQEEQVLNWKIMQYDPLAELPNLAESYYLKLPPQPFINLRPFKKEHAAIFFGRKQEIAELYQRIKGKHPIMLFYGQSGVGKSSLLDAGLLPRLENEYEIKYIRRGEKGAVESLKELLGVQENARILEAWLGIERKGKALLIILDQLEEAFTKNKPEEAKEEFNALFAIISECFDAAGIKPKGRIILSYRKEFHPELEELAQEFSLPYTDFFLKRLARAGIVEAIEGITKHPDTLQKYDLKILSSEEGDLPGIIADDLIEDAESALAPVLQILLSRMWEGNKQREFSIELYQELKRKGYLLQDFFDRQMAKLETHMAEIVQSGLALDVLYSYTTKLTTAKSLDNKELQGKYPHVAGQIDLLLQQLEDLYLISTKEKSLRSLSHDTLAAIIQKEHKDSDKPGQRAYRILESKNLNAVSDQALLDEADLQTVEAGEKGMRIRSEQEEQLKIKSQTARKKRHIQKIRRRQYVLLTAILILGFGVASLIFYIQSTKNQKDAQAFYWSGLAERILPEDHTTALRIAEAAYALDSVNPQVAVVQTLGSIYKRNYLTKLSYRSAPVMEHEEAVLGAVYSKDEKNILSWSEDGHVKLWSLEAGPNRGKLLVDMVHEGPVRGATFDKHEDRVFSWSEDGHVKLWFVGAGPDRGKLLANMSHEGYVYGVSFSKQGDKLLSWSGFPASSVKGHVKLWSIAPGPSQGQLMVDMVHTYGILGAIFSSDEDKVLGWSEDGHVKVWSLGPGPDQGKLLADMAHESSIMGAIFNKAGDRVLSWAGKTYKACQAKLWSVGANPGQSRLLANMVHEKSVEGATFISDEDQVLSWSEDGHIKLWTVEEGPDQGKLLIDMKHEEAVRGTNFNKEGNRLLSWSGNTFGRTGQVKLWSMEAGGDQGKLLADMLHEGLVSGTISSWQDDRVLSWSTDAYVKLWSLGRDVDQARLLSELKHEKRVIGAIFNREKSNVLSWSSDGRVKLWTGEPNSDRGKLLADMVHEQAVIGARFSKKGNEVLSWDVGGHVKLWTIGTSLNQGELLPNILHNPGINGVSFGKDEDKVLSWSRRNRLGRIGQVKIWSLEPKPGQNQRMAAMAHEKDVNGALFSKNEDKVLSWSTDGHLRLWSVDADADQNNLLVDMVHEASVKSAVFSSDEDKVLSWSGNHMDEKRGNGSIKLWYVGEGPDQGRLLLDMVHATGPISEAVFSKQEDKVLSWYGDGHVKIWSVAAGQDQGKLLAEMKHEGVVGGAVFSKDENLVLSWSGDPNIGGKGQIKLWSVKENPDQPNLLLETEHEYPVKGAVLSKNEDRVLGWSEFGQVKVWSIEPGSDQGKLLAETAHIGAINGAVFNKAEDKVLSWSGNMMLRGKGQVKVWTVGTNPEKTRVLADLEHEGAVKAAIFSKEEDQVISWTNDLMRGKGNVKLWHVGEDSGQVKLLADMTHAGPVNGVALSKDENELLSWSSDAYVKVWSIADGPDQGRMLAEMQHEKAILGAGFSKNEDKVLSWDSNGDIKIWHTPQGVFKALRNASVAKLTDKELKKYGIPKGYRK